MSASRGKKRPCPPGCVPNSEVGLKFRQTHYILGKDDTDYTSEYRYEYNPKKSMGDDLLNSNRGIFLRSSHFLLGDTPNDYQTSSQVQSETIPTKIYLKTENNLEENKNKLHGTHFILGNENNDYITKYNSEYYNKNPLLHDNHRNELEFIANKLKETHIGPTSNEVNYESETQAKYRKPNLSLSELKKNKNLLKLNTAALQQSHLQLGKQEVPWVSTSRYYMTPKKNLSNRRYISNEKLQESHISFSKDKDRRNFKSEAMDAFVEMPLNFNSNSIDVNLKNNLRAEHFKLGNDDSSNNRISTNRVDFQDPRLDKNYMPRVMKNIIDAQKYRRSNWTISNGDERDFFKSTYNQMMTPKKPEINKKNEVKTFQSSIKIGGNTNPNDFQSEYKNKFNDNKLKNNLKNLEEDKKLMDTINNIRKSHFNFGDNKNDYRTSNADTYIYDPKLAKDGRGVIDPQLKNNLQSSHYELGMGHDLETITSNRRDYQSYPGYKNIKKVEPNNESHIFTSNRNVFEGESIYMSDYTEKPLCDPDTNIPNYL
jgi:hypothetical protein